MISRLIGGFVSILIGVSLVGPVSQQVMLAASTTNSTGSTCSSTDHGVATEGRCELYLSAGWGATVLRLVPGFFALGILGIGIAVTYGALKDADVV